MDRLNGKNGIYRHGGKDIGDACKCYAAAWSYVGYWWLRSPNNNNSNNARYVNNDGNVNNNNVNNQNNGVVPDLLLSKEKSRRVT